MTAQITYVRGDATRPHGDGPRIIAHCCNDEGKWGAGFVLALSKRWPQPEADYRDWYRQGPGAGFVLGATELVRVEPDLWVANMIGQHGIRRSGGVAPIRYDALGMALGLLADHAQILQASVHMPRIGCGLAGGTWNKVEPLIAQNLTGRGVPVTVYDLP